MHSIHSLDTQRHTNVLSRWCQCRRQSDLFQSSQLFAARFVYLNVRSEGADLSGKCNRDITQRSSTSRPHIGRNHICAYVFYQVTLSQRVVVRSVCVRVCMCVLRIQADIGPCAVDGWIVVAKQCWSLSVSCSELTATYRPQKWTDNQISSQLTGPGRQRTTRDDCFLKLELQQARGGGLPHPVQEICRKFWCIIGVSDTEDQGEAGWRCSADQTYREGKNSQVPRNLHAPPAGVTQTKTQTRTAV